MALFGRAGLDLGGGAETRSVVGCSMSFMRVDRSIVVGITCLTIVGKGRYRLCPPFDRQGSLYVSHKFLGRLRRHFCLV